MLDDDSSLKIVTADGVEAIERVVVSPNYFQVLGIRPARGRLFDARDLTQPGRAAVLACGAWQQRFGGDERIVVRPATLGGTTFDIVGVLPKHFVFPSSLAGTPEVVTAAEPGWRVGSGGALHPIVRLEAGITREQALYVSRAVYRRCIGPWSATGPPLHTATAGRVPKGTVLAAEDELAPQGEFEIGRVIHRQAVRGSQIGERGECQRGHLVVNGDGQLT
jgi:hypothetical protein